MSRSYNALKCPLVTVNNQFTLFRACYNSQTGRKCISWLDGFSGGQLIWVFNICKMEQTLVQQNKGYDVLTWLQRMYNSELTLPRSQPRLWIILGKIFSFVYYILHLDKQCGTKLKGIQSIKNSHLFRNTVKFLY